MLRSSYRVEVLFLLGLLSVILLAPVLLKSTYFSTQLSVKNGDLHPYHHTIDQLQWLYEFSNDNSDLSFGKTPSIYYDRELLYHETSIRGCRYRCNFPKTYANLSEGDAAVFSSTFSPIIANELKERKVLVVFESGEAPPYMPQMEMSQLSQVDMFITFQSASPVCYNYAIFVRNVNPKHKFTKFEKDRMLARNSTHLLPPFHRNRTRLIAWVVSNSRRTNTRVLFANAISNFSQVDIYGRQNLALPRDSMSFQWLSERYKFYLAFENSNCREYITEKVYYNALRHNMIPIVLGAYKEDYASILPPHSYINVDDFKSIKQLTDYLLYLDNNDTAYASYFAWKEHGSIVFQNRPDCGLCGYMHQLNAGRITLKKLGYSQFYDQRVACFDRPLLPLQ